LRAQYRSPLNYSDQHLNDANQALLRLYTALKNVPPVDVSIDWQTPYAKRFKDALDDDFNTPEAFAVLFELANEANRSKSAEISGLLKALGNLLGLLESDPLAFMQDAGGSYADDSTDASGTLTNERIEELIYQRLSAKKDRNFTEADRIRKELSDQGVVLEDSPQGTTWRRV
jgi:cysteinyl-tRNA synthetase